MSELKVSISLGRSAIEDWDTISAYVIGAERLGVDSVWSAEAWAHDGFTPLAFLAARTERIKLGTGIIQAGTRTPALVAMSAMSLASMSHDRFLLGLGNSGPQVIEGWHGVSFQKPVTRLREVVEATRIALRGERLLYNGTVYHLPRPGGEGKALRSGARPRHVPIYLATLSPKALEITGELADGWLAASFMPEHADVFFSHIARGAARAGRTLADLDLRAGGSVAFSDDVDRLVQARRPGIAFSLGAMGSPQHNFYNDAYRRAGFDEEARYVQRLWLEGKQEQAAAAVPEEMVLKTGLFGTEEMVLRRIRAYRDAGITTLSADPAGANVEERLSTLARFLTLVQQVNAETAPAAPVG